MVYRKWTRNLVLPMPFPSVAKVETLLLLGVLLDRHLLFSAHVTKTLAQAAQSRYALKALRSSGLSLLSLDRVCRATMVARILYASPCWWGAIYGADRDRLQAAINRAARWCLCLKPPTSVSELCTRADRTLFKAVLENRDHVLRPLLPPPKPRIYNLRKRLML